MPEITKEEVATCLSLLEDIKAGVREWTAVIDEDRKAKNKIATAIYDLRTFLVGKHTAAVLTEISKVDTGIPCPTCGSTDGWICEWCRQEKSA